MKSNLNKDLDRIIQEKSKKTLNRVHEELIHRARIICTTLSTSTCSKLSGFLTSPDYLIVDEACQSTELQTLIAFMHNPKRVVLVGDPKQLPATCFM